MADTNIVSGLFGITPQAYNQQQQQLINAEAQQFAQLDPYQQVTAGSYGAGRQLGRGIVGALGGQDPQLKIISLRQQVAQGMNPNDLNSVQQAAETLARAGDQQGALTLADYLRKAQGDYALIQQRTKEQMTPEQRNAEAKAGLMDVISQLENMPASPERDRALTMRKNQLTSLTAGKPEKVADAIQVAREIGVLTEALKNETEGTPAYKSIKVQLDRLQKQENPVEFEKILTEAGFIKGSPEYQTKMKEYAIGKIQGLTKPLVYNQAAPVAAPDWSRFMGSISNDPVMQRTSTIISDAPNAIETIKMSTENNFASASLPSALAKLTGEGKNMSNQDVNRYARTGGLDERLAQDAVKFFTGKTTEVNKLQAEKFATAVYRGALLERKQFLKDNAEQYGYLNTPNYASAIGQIDNQLAKFKPIAPQSTTTTNPSAIQTRTGNSLVDKYLNFQ